MPRKNTIFRALPIVAAHYGERFGVKVIVGGSGASTDGNTILVPNVPEDYPNKNVLWGYTTHEAAHIRHTNFRLWDSVASSSSPIRSKLLNILEDVRIENAMMNEFPGVRSDLESTVSYLKDTNRFESVSSEDLPTHILETKIISWLRSNILKQSLGDLERSAESAMQFVFPSGVNTRLAVLLRKVSTTQSTECCLKLTDSIIKMLDEEAEKEQEGQPDESQSVDDSADAFSDDQPGSENEQASSPSADASQAADADASDSFQENIQQVLKASDGDFAVDAYDSLKEELCQEADVNGDDTYCTVPVAPDSSQDPLLGDDLLSKVQSTISKLRAQLMGLVQSSRRNRDFPCRNGRSLYRKRITRIISGDTRVFRQRESKVQANTAVHILTDMSGSMRGYEDQVAREASLAIALALESIPGVSPAVTYFSGTSIDPVRSAVRHGQSVKKNAHRFMESSRGYTPMAEGIWYAAYQLSQVPEERKLIIAITDGNPDSDSACHTVINLCRNAGIDMVGIGIRHHRVQEFFEQSIVINSVTELKNSLFQLMRDKLTTNAA